ncbi:uncharacterized protein [Zea mays]|nr:uncharacterized protein LOC103634586 isoform X1 [Zea mays]|eukprot:XP_023157016.1 uncharacterized protein LOC103634586 isoform X2 [Zea mays]
MRHLEEDDEIDDELDQIMALMMGQYKKRKNGQRKKRRGSVFGHKVHDRSRQEHDRKLFQDYFAENPTYPEKFFRRRFRMSSSLFKRIAKAVEKHDEYFVQDRNAAGVLGFSCLQKVTAAFRQLAYGVPADYVDEYLRIGESTAIESLRKFVKAVCEVFGPQYLRAPNEDDTARLLSIAEQRGFPGMLGSIDCMHWKWKNCPTAYQGTYCGHVKEPTIILEAVASHDLWIWHAFFGLPGSLNDINVLHRSHLFDRLVEGKAPAVNYTINGHKYDMGYYLADGIYPNWSAFVKSIKAPANEKDQNFTAAQESLRKDVERAFGVLQARFAIVRGPARFWDVATLRNIMKACIIMHNMIIEDERDAGRLEPPYEKSDAETNGWVSHVGTSNLSAFIDKHKDIAHSFFLWLHEISRNKRFSTIQCYIRPHSSIKFRGEQQCKFSNFPC